MSSTLFPAFRARLAAFLLLGCIAPFATVQAQNPPPAEQQSDPGQTAAGRGNQRIEHIRIEDGRNTIDELRVGGRTQNITVQPKSSAPAFQVMPNEQSRSEGQPSSGAGSSGSRVWWNAVKF
jgi:hypothetical protein